MNTDVEELLRHGMERFTADVRAPAGLASEAGRRHRQHRRRARAAVACGTAAVAGVTAAAVVLAAGPGAAARPAGSPAQAHTVAYVTKRVENALATENMVYVGRSSDYGAANIAIAYGNQNVWEQYAPTTDYRDRIVDGKHLWDFPPQFRGKLESVQGTALVGGKLVDALVTYYNKEYAIYGPAVTTALAPCSATAALVMASAPLIPNSHWTRFLNGTLRCGAAAVTGHVKIGGHEAIRITGKPITVKLQPGYGKLVGAKWVTARWTLYVDPATYLPVRMYGSLEQSGGRTGTYVMSGVTDVRWLPASPANIARSLLTIPPGFHRMGPNYTG
jgi:hypothetical protein